MKLFFSTLPRNFIGCFKGRMLLWHLAAIVLTLALVLSGFDWQYFLWTRSPMLHSWMFPAVHIGGRLPILLPLTLLVLGGIGRSASTRLVGWAIGQAEIIGGNCRCRLQGNYGPCSPSARHRHRNGPEPCFQVRPAARGVFWGWPSSHTTIAFAMAVTVFRLFPKQKWLGCLALTYAFYVGIGVSMTIHWFSDFVAGALIGTAIGIVVANSFSRAALQALPLVPRLR
jgi:membrane-associated phospholipid phosphatase